MSSIQRQSSPPQEIILVIDHNPKLCERAKKEFPAVRVIENTEDKGASGSKNSGVSAANSRIVAFLDDDAKADIDWLRYLRQEFENSNIVGVGGLTLPLWPQTRPAWFPEEFFWVVGCTHRGMPEEAAPVRNLIACNMAVLKTVFNKVGGFRNGIGPMGSHALGCEETEFCIRVSQVLPNSIWLHQPQAIAWHHVSPARTSWRYFLRRCYGEGKSKALITSFVGSKDGLASERVHAFKNLPIAVLNGVRETVLGKDLFGLVRAGAIIVGLLVTIIGYEMGRLSDLFANRLGHIDLG